MTATEQPNYIEAWVCDPPPHGTSYKVLKQEWIEHQGRNIRLIYEIKAQNPADSTAA